MSLKNRICRGGVAVLAFPILFVTSIVVTSAQEDDGDDLLELIIPVLSSITKQAIVPPPELDSQPATTTANSVFISGNALADSTVNIFDNAQLTKSARSNASGRFSTNIPLVVGANLIHATQMLNGVHSTESNRLSITRTSANRLPSAFVVYGPSSGEAPLQVSFDGSRSTDSDGRIVSYLWDFGDGTSSGSSRISHTYTTTGNYTAALTVTDNAGGQSTSPVPVEVRPATVPPVSVVRYVTDDPRARSAPLMVRFDGTDSYDSDGSIVAYQWDFGDGDGGTGATVNHTYTAPGRYTVVLTVLDNSLRSAISISQVEVLEPLTSYFEASVLGGEAPLFVELNADLSSGYINRYTWDFGDGTEATYNADNWIVNRERKLYDAAGSYTVRLSVEDIFGKTSVFQQTIEVIANRIENDLRFAVVSTTSVAPYDIHFSIDSSDIGPGLTYEFDFGDGDSAGGQVVSHGYSAPGIYTVIATARSGTELVKQSGIRLFVGRQLSGINIPVEQYPALIPEATDMPYRVTGSGLSVMGEGRLRLMPGVEIRLTDQGITVSGELSAIGTAEKPIVFTSAKVSPSHGDWSGIDLTGDNEYLFEHVTVEYAAEGINAGKNISKIIVRNARFNNNVKDVYAENIDLEIIDSEFSGTEKHAIHSGDGVFDITGNTINGGQDCVVLGGQGVFAENIVTSCLQSGIRLKGDAVLTNNIFSGINTYTNLTGPTDLKKISQLTYAGPSAAVVVDAYDKNVEIAGNEIRGNHVGILYFSNVLIPYSDTESSYIFDHSLGIDRQDHPPFSQPGKSILTWKPEIIDDNSIFANEVGLLIKYPGYVVKDLSSNIAFDYPQIEIKPTIRGNSIFNNNRANILTTGTYGFLKTPSEIDAKENWWGSTDVEEIYRSIPTERSGFSLASRQNQSERVFNLAGFLDDMPSAGSPVYPGNYVFGELQEQSFEVNGQYNVIAPLFVSSVPVTIPQGVELKFLGSRAKIEVNNHLVIDGVESNQVRITSLSPSPAANDWAGMHLARAADVSIHNAVIEYASTAIAGTGVLSVADAVIRDNAYGIDLYESAATIANSEITRNLKGIEISRSKGGGIRDSIVSDNQIGLIYSKSTKDFVITNNQISNNEHAGVSVERYVDKSLSIMGNSVEGNGVGIKLMPDENGRQSPEISGGNEIQNNNIGIEAIYKYGARVNPIVRANTITDNTSYNIKADRNNTDQSSVMIDAQLNWWGTTDSSLIDVAIFDRRDSPQEALVNYSGLLASKDAIASIDKLPPVASIQHSPAELRAYTQVTLDAGGSMDQDGSIVNYQWYFDDGSTDRGVVITKYLEQAGALGVRLEVTDDDGIIGLLDVSIPVSVAEPDFNINMSISPQTGHAFDIVSFNAFGSSSADSNIVSYSWDYGDGSSGSGLESTHIYQNPGDYFVLLTVENALGETLQRGANVTVQQQVPAIRAQMTLGNLQGQAPLEVTYDGSTSDAGISGIAYQWDFGDGTTSSDVMGSHTYSGAGEYIIALTVSDPDGNQDVLLDRVVVYPQVPGLVVSQPLDAAAIEADIILIEGTVNNIADMGVTVEHYGQVYYAMVGGSTHPATFLVQVPVFEGENDYKVKATTHAGQVEEMDISLTGLSTAESAFKVSIDKPRNYISKAIVVSVENSAGETAVEGSGYGFDYDLDGVVDYTQLFESSEIESLNERKLSFSFSFSRAGIYNIHTTILDGAGISHQAVIPVQIIDRVSLDQLIQGKWETLNRALIRGDTEVAISFFASGSRDRYRPILNLLQPRFNEIVQSYQSFRATAFRPGYLEYVLNRQIDNVDNAFFVYFVLDRDGVWRIETL